MSRGLTIADFVQQVFYAIYKVRLDTTFDPALPEAFHADTDKFQEVVMEANLVLQELQKEQDWNWLRSRRNLGVVEEPCCGTIMEITLPADAYKVCTGFNDAVRLHHPDEPTCFVEIPFTSPRSGTVNKVTMFDDHARLNMPDTRLEAFMVGNILTFNRPFPTAYLDWVIETDVVDYLEPLHLCGSSCTQPCRSAYVDLVFTQIPDPLYMVLRTAAKRAEGDPSVADRVMALTDDATKMLSAMRENDSSKTTPDTYTTAELGYTRVL